MIERTHSVTAEQLASWRSYVGREEVRRQRLDSASLRRFAAAVGASLELDLELPPLAHWAFFPDVASAAQLGVDGHPKRGIGILPPIPLPRRMFASSAMRFSAPLSLDEEATLTLRLAAVNHKAGAQGDLVFVDVERTLVQADTVRVSERQTLVYRTPGAPLAPLTMSDVPELVGQERWIPDTVELFRFSAVTFNGHRIHYDLPYAQREEGYPGLVVHGPLTAVKVFAFARKSVPGGLRGFEFRMTAPLFVNQPVYLRAAAGQDRFEAVRGDGVVALSAVVSR